MSLDRMGFPVRLYAIAVSTIASAFRKSQRSKQLLPDSAPYITVGHTTAFRGILRKECEVKG